MPTIRVLSDGLKNKIAAGEVVERPASVVKELLENSIDAGARNIRIEVQKAGRKLIKVSDDGCGMDHEDALMCFMRHATSKLTSEQDLFNINTLGFRGEALPSIASVSKMTISTKTKNSTEGITVSLDAGVITDTRPQAIDGTSFDVRELFFNTPARRKFLKTDQTEHYHIVDYVTKEALSRPETAITLVSDGLDTMSLPTASGYKERIMQVYGVDFLDGLMACAGEKYGISVESYFSKPSNLRDTKSNQHVFINRRPVRDPAVNAAVYAAYEGISLNRMHPVFFVYIEMNPLTVDFNVHPAKREVRLRDRDKVFRAVRDCISGAFGYEIKDVASNAAASGHGVYEWPRAGEALSVSEPVMYELGLKAQIPYVYIGESFVAYPEGGGITLLDCHGAHERVLYERLLYSVNLNSSMLLFPRQVKLSTQQYMLLIKHIDLLGEMGFGVEDFGRDTVLVRHMPEDIAEEDLSAILSDAASSLDEMKPVQERRNALAARIACHSSVRGIVDIGPHGLNALLDELDETKDPMHCPHGRPIRIRLSQDDIKKMFKRK